MIDKKSFTLRVKCKDINKDLCGTKITMYGWLHRIRMKGKINLLRDNTGIMQIISDHEKFRDKIPSVESVIKVSGILLERPKHQINPTMETGQYELLLEDMEVLNSSTKELPLSVNSLEDSNEQHRMKYRYLDLRKLKNQKLFRLRSNFEFLCTEYLIRHHDFLNITTPTLFTGTPGGAREFVVPTSQPGLFYSLTQSPQQHKQLLMIAGFERYMQIARCYRDETNRPDRQPEFTQLDIEMSFVERREIQLLLENMLRYSFKGTDISVSETEFPVLSYTDAISLYGSDKPDLRYLLTLSSIPNETEISQKCPALILLRKDFEKLSEDFIDILKGTATNEAKLLLAQEEWNDITKDMVKIVPGLDEVAFCIKSDFTNLVQRQILGKMRVQLGNELNKLGILDFEDANSFVWVEQFPLFEYSKNQKRINSCHHPFTAPRKSDYELLFTDPLKVTGEQFDLVCNGCEVGGGSIRIHDADMQEYIIKDILGEDVSLFHHLTTALRCGAPPHGGFALGIERLIAVLTRKSSIREVMAFSKTFQGFDLLSGAPLPLTEEQLNYYHLKILAKSKKHTY